MPTKSNKGRKVGRNSAKCQKYLKGQRRELNKGRKLLKRLKKHPNDKTAREAMKKIAEIMPRFGKAMKALEANQKGD